MSYGLLLFYGVCLGLPVAAIVAAIVRTWVLVRVANRRFLSGSLRVEPGADGAARLELRATSPARHAVWLDLDIGGALPTFALELAVTADGVLLASVAGIFGYDSAGDFQDGSEVVVAGSPFNMSLDHAVTGGPNGVDVKSVQRVAFFTPKPGDLVEVRVVVQAQPGTSLRRCALLVTATDQP